MFPSSTPNGFLTTENDCFEWCWKSPTKTRFGCCALVYFFAGSNLAGRMWNPIYRHVFRHFSTSRIRIWRRKKLLRKSWNWHMTSFWPSRVGHKLNKWYSLITWFASRTGWDREVGFTTCGVSRPRILEIENRRKPLADWDVLKGKQ